MLLGRSAISTTTKNNNKRLLHNSLRQPYRQHGRLEQRYAHGLPQHHRIQSPGELKSGEISETKRANAGTVRKTTFGDWGISRLNGRCHCHLPVPQGTEQGGRRRGRRRKRWEDNIREWTGLEWNIMLRKAENPRRGGNWLLNLQWCPNGQPDYGTGEGDRG